MQPSPAARVEMFTDGACRDNPGPGGWGVLLRIDGAERELCGGEPATTNNRMELLAAIKGLEALAGPSQVALTTDSEYVRGGITEWIGKWKARGWRTSAKKPVKNQDLWERLDRLNQLHQVEWRWVKGHSGHAGNERADALANRGIDQLPPQPPFPRSMPPRTGGGQESSPHSHPHPDRQAPPPFPRKRESSPLSRRDGKEGNHGRP